MTWNCPLSLRGFSAAVTAVFVVVALLPVATVFVGSFFPGVAFSLEAYRSVLAEARQWGLLRNTLVLAAGTSLLATVFGAPYGLVLEYLRVPGRRVLAAAAVLPLLIPPYVGAVAWAGLLGRRGWIQFGLNLAGQDLSIIPVYSLAGAIWVLSLAYFPIPAFATALALRRYDAGVEEPARLAASPGRTFLHITLPLIGPAAATGALIVFILGLVEFTVPSLLMVNVYAVEIYERFSVSYDAAAAAAQAVPLLVGGAGAFLLWALYAAPRRGRLPGKGRATRRAKGAGLAAVAGWLLVGIAVVLPLALLVRDSLPLRTYVEVWQTARDEIRTSMVVAASSATVLTALAAAMAYIARCRALGHRLHALSPLPFVVSGPLLGIGLIRLWNRAGFPALVYDSLAILILACAAHSLFFCYAAAHAALRDLPRSLDEAAEACGVSWVRTATGVLLPLTAPALVGAWGIGFALAFRELDAAVLVAPPGWSTLSIRLFSLMHYGPTRLTAALSVVSAVLVLLGALAAAGGVAVLRRTIHADR